MNWPFWLVGGLVLLTVYVAANGEIYFCPPTSHVTKWAFQETSNCSKRLNGEEKLSKHPIRVTLFTKQNEWINFTSTLCLLRNDIVEAGRGHSNQVHIQNHTVALNSPLSEQECRQMIRNGTCRYGLMEKTRDVFQLLDNQDFQPRNWFMAAILGTYNYEVKGCLAFQNYHNQLNTVSGEIYIPRFASANCSYLSTSCFISDRILIVYDQDLKTRKLEYMEVVTNAEAYFVGRKSIYVSSQQLTIDLLNYIDKSFDSNRYASRQGFLVTCANSTSGDPINCTRAGSLDYQNNSGESFEIGESKGAQLAGRLRTLQQQSQKQFELQYGSMCKMQEEIQILRQQYAILHPHQAMSTIFGTRAIQVEQQYGIFSIKFCMIFPKAAITFKPDGSCTRMIVAKVSTFNDNFVYIDSKTGEAHINIGPHENSHVDCAKAITFKFFDQRLLYNPITGHTTEIEVQTLPFLNTVAEQPLNSLVRYIKPLGDTPIDPIRLICAEQNIANKLINFTRPSISSHPRAIPQPTGTIWSWIWEHPMITSFSCLTLLGSIILSVLCCCGKIPSCFVALFLIRDAYRCIQSFRQNQPPPNQAQPIQPNQV